MSGSSAVEVRGAREKLGEVLGLLQQSADVPADVASVTEHVAQAVGALFEAENANDGVGKASIRKALGLLSQTLALLQDARQSHASVESAAETLASTMSVLYPLTTRPTVIPPPGGVQVENLAEQRASTRPGVRSGAPQKRLSVPAKTTASSDAARTAVEANIGATTESNFFVGFSGEIAEGGVFVATYNTLPAGTPVDLLVTLPGGFEEHINGMVSFVRDPLDMTDDDASPGMGVRFETLSDEQRELILRFIRKRAPSFYDE